MELQACALCDCRILPSNDSREHIIPQALGGRKKVLGFICRNCNNNRGNSWDAALAAELNWFCVALNVSRERGAPPKQRVKGLAGQNIWLHADGSMTLDEPLVTVEKTDSGRRFLLKPQSMAEARKKLREIQKKHAEIDVEKELANAVINAVRPGVIYTTFAFCGELGGRSLVKTAMAMAYDMGIESHACDFALRYLRDSNAAPALAEFYIRDFVLNRPSQQLINSVTVTADPRKNTLIAYVEYFGVVRYVVHLSQTYSGPPKHCTYAIDTKTGRPADLHVDLNLSDNEHAASLADETGDESRFPELFQYAMPIALKSLYAREDEHAMRIAIGISLVIRRGFPGVKSAESKK
jgi:hypothetical protein